MSLRILIVEDEPLVQQRLARFCREILGAGAVVHCASGLDDADDVLRSRLVDVLLLDLTLDGEDGFVLLRRATAGVFHTIVVSARGDRALEAFELGVLDFVHKPFTRERLAHALARCTSHGARSAYARHLGVWRQNGVALVPVDEVNWIEADGDYTTLQLQSGRRELHEKSLERLLQLLPPQFVRVHRSYVVNLDRVERLVVESGSRYRLVLHDGATVPVGRSRVQELKGRLG